MADENINFHYRAFGLNQVHAGTERVNRSSGALVTTHSRMNKAVAGLALRFVGYQMVLSQVMGAQQKLIQLVGESISKFREFETRLAEVSTILQEDVDQMARFKIGIESLSTTYGKATSDISKGLYDILSAAFAAEDAMNLLNTSIKASIAGLSDVRTAVQIFTTVLNAYGMSAEQATHVSDVLFQAVIRGKFQFAELEQALGYVVPIAAQAGIGIEELTAALSTATRHGLHLDMTARGLALAIQNIINPSEGAAKAARKYGIEMNGLAIRVLGLKGWFDELKEATDKYGKGVIGELIPNMRSVRVAMVLAGEEGAKGFADDLRYLEDITGRTDEALGEITKTAEFASKQLEQMRAEFEREIGSQWSDAFLGIKEHLLGLAQTVGLVGNLLFNDLRNWESHWENYYAKMDKLHGYDKKALIENYDALDKYGKALVYIQSLAESGDVSSKIYDAIGAGATQQELEELNEELERHNLIMEVTRDAYNLVTGGIENVQDELGRLETNLGEILLEIDKVNDALRTPVEYGTQGKTIAGSLYLEMKQLEATQLQVEAQHDIKMGLVDSTYQWVINNDEIEKAVKIIREHTEAQKKDRRETDLMSIAMKELQIQSAEIQLSGMVRRRGLSRSEEKQLKRLQIQQAKMRLENMKAQEKETEETVDAYQTAQDAIDEYLMTIKEEVYQLKYSYDQQWKDLDARIKNEERSLKDLADYYTLTQQGIISNSEQMYLDLLAIAKNPELKDEWEDMYGDIDEAITAILEKIAEARATTNLPS